MADAAGPVNPIFAVAGDAAAMGAITITTEPSRLLIRAHMSGMLVLPVRTARRRADPRAHERDAHRRRGRGLFDERAGAVMAMGLGSGEFDLLVETEGNVVQTQEVMDAFAALIQRTPLKARRIATVRDGVLTRMQSRRMSRLRSGAAVFDTVAAAEAWLAA